MWLNVNWAAWRRPWWRRRKSAARPGSASTGPARERAAAVDPFERALATLAAAPDGGAGRLRVVSLADFHQAVGDKWSRLADKVAMIADAVIRRHVGPGNLYRRQGDDLWLLAFLNGTAETARAAAGQIAQDLSRHLLGDACVGGERPLALVAHVAAKTALTQDGRLDQHAVTTAIEDSRSLLEAHADTVSAAPSWRPLPRPDGNARPAAQWQTVHRNRPAGPQGEPWATIAPMPADARLRLVWRPTWVAEGEAISAYCARIVRLDRADAEPLEGPMAYPAEDTASVLRLDRFVTSAALNDLRAAHAAGHKAGIIMPLSWTTVHQHGGELLQPFAELSEEMRRDWVRIEVFRIPDDATPDQLEAVAAFSRKLCGDVLLRLRLGSPLMDRIGTLGAGHVGLDLSELRADERMNDDLLLSTLEKLQDCAFQAGAGCYLWSARRRQVVGGVVRHGFEMVNGPGLMRDVGRPAAAVPAPRRRFVSSPCAPAG